MAFPVAEFVKISEILSMFLFTAVAYSVYRTKRFFPREFSRPLNLMIFGFVLIILRLLVGTFVILIPDNISYWIVYYLFSIHRIILPCIFIFAFFSLAYEFSKFARSINRKR